MRFFPKYGIIISLDDDEFIIRYNIDQDHINLQFEGIRSIFCLEIYVYSSLSKLDADQEHFPVNTEAEAQSSNGLAFQVTDRSDTDNYYTAAIVEGRHSGRESAEMRDDLRS